MGSWDAMCTCFANVTGLQDAGGWMGSMLWVSDDDIIKGNVAVVYASLCLVAECGRVDTRVMTAMVVMTHNL